MPVRLSRAILAVGALGASTSCDAILFRTGVAPDSRNPIPTCSHQTLRPAIEQLLKPVLYAWVAAEDSDQHRDAYYAAFERLLAMHTADAHEAQAALMAYYIGEHSGEELLEALLAEPQVFDPLVTTYRTCRPRLTSEWQLTGMIALRTLYDHYTDERREEEQRRRTRS